MTAPDTPTQRARRLLAAATPGPWKKDRGTWDPLNNTTDVLIWPKKLTGLTVDEIALVITSWVGASVADRKQARANAALIAAAPTLLADLADENDRLRERLDDSWYTDIGARLDAAEAERDELRAELDRYVQLTTDIDAVRQCWHADEGPNWTANVLEALRHSGLIDTETPT